jgi:cell division protein FtsB
MSSIQEIMKQIVALKEQLKISLDTLEEVELPIEGDVWEMMKKHVLNNTEDDEKLEYIDGESVRDIWTLDELYDKEEIVEHIRKSDIPPGAIYTTTQLSQSCEFINKELLATNNSLYAKNVKLLADNNRLRANRNELLAENNRLRTNRNELLEENNRRRTNWNELLEENNRIRYNVQRYVIMHNTLTPTDPITQSDLFK